MLSEPRRRVRFLSRQEADALLEALSAHLRPVVSFGLATGCRMSETLNLEWQRVDFDRRVAWLDHGTTKNGEGRGIPLNNDAIIALRAVEGNHGRWCFTYQGKRMERVGSGFSLCAAPSRLACGKTSTTSPYPKHFVGQALLVYGPPKVMLLATDLYKNRIDEERVTISTLLSL